MESLTIELNPSQFDALDLIRTKKYVAYCGGFGSGKSFLGSLFLIAHHLQNPGTKTAFYGPTFRLIKDIFLESIGTVAELHDLSIRVNLSDPYVDLIDSDGQYLGRIICRSVSLPGSIIGYQVSASCCDEIDTVDRIRMSAAWKKIMARQRLVVPGGNRILCTTTPEGFGFTYSQFFKNKNPDYGLVQCATIENEEHLPEDYIQTLTDSYDEKLIQSYLLGQFTNLNSGSVYHQFDRKLNGADHVELIDHEPIHCGIDFNVTNCSVTVFVVRFGKDFHWSPAAPKGLKHERAVLIKEMTGLYDTPAVIDALKQEFPKRKITVYPDASGKQRHSADAAITDIRLLQAAKFQVEADRRNPMIRDRINNVNRMICHNGTRLFYVNTKMAPESTEALENSAYNPDTGQPNKDGYDHLCDSIGYFLSRRYGIARPIAKVSSF